MAPPSTPEHYPTQDMFGETFQVIVGEAPEKTKTFVLHKGAAAFYSDFFAAALKKDTFVESAEGSIKLPEENVDVFEKFVLWLYTRQIGNIKEVADLDWVVYLWLFADRRQIPLLMNTLLNELRDAVVKLWVTPTHLLQDIYHNTTESAGLRRFLVMFISRCADGSLCKPASRIRWPADAMWDLMKAMLTQKDDNTTRLFTSSEIANLDICEYHVHEEGVRCEKN